MRLMNIWYYSPLTRFPNRYVIVVILGKLACRATRLLAMRAFESSTTVRANWLELLLALSLLSFLLSRAVFVRFLLSFFSSTTVLFKTTVLFLVSTFASVCFDKLLLRPATMLLVVSTLAPIPCDSTWLETRKYPKQMISSVRRAIFEAFLLLQLIFQPHNINIYTQSNCIDSNIWSNFDENWKCAISDANWFVERFYGSLFNSEIGIALDNVIDFIGVLLILCLQSTIIIRFHFLSANEMH